MGTGLGESWYKVSRNAKQLPVLNLQHDPYQAIPSGVLQRGRTVAFPREIQLREARVEQKTYLTVQMQTPSLRPSQTQPCSLLVLHMDADYLRTTKWCACGPVARRTDLPPTLVEIEVGMFAMVNSPANL